MRQDEKKNTFFSEEKLAKSLFAYIFRFWSKFEPVIFCGKMILRSEKKKSSYSLDASRESLEKYGMFCNSWKVFKWR